MQTDTASSDDQAAMIWVDADSCPVPVREILNKAATRTETLVCYVANQYLNLPKSLYIKMVQVQAGFDVADNEIVERSRADDLVITSDIPLASELIDKQVSIINFRGEVLTPENIKSRLNMRDFMDSMRASGVQEGGSAPYGQQDKQKFANQLDRWLSKHKK